MENKFGGQNGKITNVIKIIFQENVIFYLILESVPDFF